MAPDLRLVKPCFQSLFLILLMAGLSHQASSNNAGKSSRSMSQSQSSSSRSAGPKGPAMAGKAAVAEDVPVPIVPPPTTGVRPIFERRSESANKIGEHANLNTEEIIRRYKYPVESHIIITEDKYILKAYRIPRGKYQTQSEKRPVAYLQDGIHFTSNVWFLAAEVSLPFLLADQGYDVWLGNSRESLCSRHLQHSQNSTEYWDFGIDEIGTYDRPATIDYILRVTGVHKINYIGYSLGTTQLFILLSTKPEYNSKIARAIAITPLVYIKNTRSHISHLRDNPKDPQIGISPSTDTTYPASRSRIFDHLNQWIKSDNFTAFCFGEEKNKLRYKTTIVDDKGVNTSVGLASPPSYNLSKVKVPIFGLYANGDDIVVAEDALRTLNEMGHWANRETSQVQNSDWGHFDFLYSDGIKTYVNDPIITFLEMDVAL